MITFSDIYEAMRKEKYSEQLQILPKTFLRDVSQYFNEKKEMLNKDDDMFSDVSLKNKKKLDNSLSSFRDLLRIRKKKILNLAFVSSEVGINKRDFENLLAFEKDLFESSVKALEKAEKDMSAEMAGSGEQLAKHELVRFVEDVSEFLNFDGEEIGPFKKGEIANLEKEIVGILENDKKVEVLVID